MRWAVLLLALLGLGTAAGLLLQDDNGYVLLAWGGWSVETSLVFFVVMALVALLQGRGMNPHILSRGYGGAEQGPVAGHRAERMRREDQEAECPQAAEQAEHRRQPGAADEPCRNP